MATPRTKREGGADRGRPGSGRRPGSLVAELEAHFRKVADASDLPVMLNDIPGRTGTRSEPETMIRLAAHPRIVAVKNCSHDVLGTQKVLAHTDLAYYAGCVSTIPGVVPGHIAAILDAFDTGDTTRATELQWRAVPLIEAMTGAGLPGTVTAQAFLARLGLPAGPVRAPLRPAGRETADGLPARYEALAAG